MTSSPSSVVADYIARVRSVANVVRENADKAEAGSRPADEVIEAFREAGLFTMLVPASEGGGGLSSWEVGPVVEEMSRIEGSAGWTLALGQRMLAQRLSGQARQSLFGDEPVLMAGVIEPGACTCDPGWARLPVQRERNIRQQRHA
jgi:indole-3-acetate monooxygenase